MHSHTPGFDPDFDVSRVKGDALIFVSAWHQQISKPRSRPIQVKTRIFVARTAQSIHGHFFRTELSGNRNSVSRSEVATYREARLEHAKFCNRLGIPADLQFLAQTPPAPPKPLSNELYAVLKRLIFTDMHVRPNSPYTTLKRLVEEKLSRSLS